VIQRTTPVSQKRITYQTEYVGTNTVIKVIVYNMLNFTLAAEYRGIVVIKRICPFYRIYDGPTITVFDGRDIFPRSFTPLYVLLTLRPAFTFVV
jgi:hypothetical protein